MVSTKFNALLFSVLALTLATGAVDNTAFVTLQCRQLQTSTSRLAIIGDCLNKEGDTDYYLTYMYAWHCVKADGQGQLDVLEGPSDEPHQLEDYCDQCSIIEHTGLICHCMVDSTGEYQWSNIIDIDSAYELDGFGNLICRQSGN